ncbi:hypothetical protein Hdeb2414_s0016g00499811 [Helianthus debilis subsp. tardiflorus]
MKPDTGSKYVIRVILFIPYILQQLGFHSLPLTLFASHPQIFVSNLQKKGFLQKPLSLIPSICHIHSILHSSSINILGCKVEGFIIFLDLMLISSCLISSQASTCHARVFDFIIFLDLMLPWFRVGVS